jgi:hypothetical protein
MSGIGLLAAQSGNLGGGREGVMRSELASQSNLDRAALLATTKTTRIYTITKFS